MAYRKNRGGKIEIEPDDATFTVAGNGETVAPGGIISVFSLQVKGTGAAATAWNVVLEGSLDSTNFTTILSHVNGTQTDGETAFSGASRMACKFFRVRCVSVTLGSATDITVKYVATN